METIRKKMCIEDLKSHTPGAIPFFVFNSGVSPTVTTSGESGNWGNFPINIPIGEPEEKKSRTYLSVMSDLHKIEGMRKKSLKLKKNSKGAYTTHIIEDYTEDDYSYYDASDFESDINGFFHKISGECEDDLVALVSEWDSYAAINLGSGVTGSSFCGEVKKYIGILNTTYNDYGEKIGGAKTPPSIYFAEIKKYIKRLEDFKSGDCCSLIKYEEYGGDLMYNHLKEHENDYEEATKAITFIDKEESAHLIPASNVGLFINQDYNDFGIYTPYENSESSEVESHWYSAIEEDGSINPKKSFTTDSKLHQVRSRQKNFGNDSKELPYIITNSGTTYDIPYKKGELFNKVFLYSDEVYNYYSCDYVKDIIYLFEDGTTGETWTDGVNIAKEVDLRYVIGGKYFEKVSEEEECSIYGDIETLNFSAAGGSKDISFNSTCGWEATIIEDGDVYFLLYDGDDEIPTESGITISRHERSIKLFAASDTKWTIEGNSALTISPYTQEGDYYITIDCINELPEDCSITVRYGSSFEYKKTYGVRLNSEDDEYLLLPEDAYISHSGGDISFLVTSNCVTWKASFDSIWGSVKSGQTGGKKDGKEIKEVKIKIDKNTNPFSRVGGVVFKCGKMQYVYSITQEEGHQMAVFTDTIESLLDSIAFGGDSGETTAWTQTNISTGWTATCEYEPYIYLTDINDNLITVLDFNTDEDKYTFKIQYGGDDITLYWDFEYFGFAQANWADLSVLSKGESEQEMNLTVHKNDTQEDRFCKLICYLKYEIKTKTEEGEEDTETKIISTELQIIQKGTYGVS